MLCSKLLLIFAVESGKIILGLCTLSGTAWNLLANGGWIDVIAIKNERIIENENLLAEIANGEAHYIAWANPGLTFAATMCQQGLKINADAYKALFMEVNTKKETGTVYPRANMTFLPVSEANYYMHTEKHHDSEYAKEDEFIQFRDAFIANRDYIKATKLYLDLRDFELYNNDKAFTLKLVERYGEIITDIFTQEQMTGIEKVVMVYMNLGHEDDKMTHITEVNGWKYYINKNDGDKIYRISTEDTGRAKLSDDNTSIYRIDGEWIYYQNKSYGYRLYRMKLDGSNVQKLTDDAVDFFNVHDNYISYKNIRDNFKYYYIRKDGSGRTDIMLMMLDDIADKDTE